MTEQLTLDDLPHEPTRYEKFLTWATSHPKVMALFEAYALEMYARRRKFGVAALLERVRWEVRRTWETDEDGYKINNNHKPFIARYLIAKYPALADFIQLRSIRSDEQEG